MKRTLARISADCLRCYVTVAGAVVVVRQEVVLLKARGNVVLEEGFIARCDGDVVVARHAVISRATVGEGVSTEKVLRLPESVVAGTFSVSI